MAPILLALTATLAQPGAYTAGGSEPFWGLEIAGGQMTYEPGDDRRLIAATPRRRPIRNGYRYVTRIFTVEIRHVRCEDEGERVHSDTVRVTANGTTVWGCGGTLLPPATLADTDWRIVAIGGEAVNGDNYAMQFTGAGRLNGQAGCNRFSGRYAQRRIRLTAGPIAATRMACPGARMAHERAVLHILGGQVTIGFPDGETMMLTAGGGSIRLRRVL
ncbi:MAG TPA: META domain-containing protein [Allosphingosinicella sp.]|jgi:heat shock protein HslJ|nr:META domain-containing protein [Allosphingosinicella sp.]